MIFVLEYFIGFLKLFYRLFIIIIFIVKLKLCHQVSYLFLSSDYVLISLIINSELYINNPILNPMYIIKSKRLKSKYFIRENFGRTNWLLLCCIIRGKLFFFFLREHYQGQTNNTLKEYRWVRPTSHIINLLWLTS